MKFLPVDGVSEVMDGGTVSHICAFAATEVITVNRNTHLQISVAVLMLVVQHQSWYQRLDTFSW